MSEVDGGDVLGCTHGERGVEEVIGRGQGEEMAG